MPEGPAGGEAAPRHGRPAGRGVELRDQLVRGEGEELRELVGEHEAVDQGAGVVEAVALEAVQLRQLVVAQRR